MLNDPWFYILAGVLQAYVITTYYLLTKPR